MDLGPDNFGSEKPAETGANGASGSNGFTFPRDVDLAGRDRPAMPAATPEPARDDRLTRSSAASPRRAPGASLSSVPASSASSAAAPLGSAPAPLGGTSPTAATAATPHEWFRAQPGSPAEHPLLRGLLLELPPRNAPLDKAWLEHWLEAARATLELIYSRSDGPGAAR